MKGSTEDKIVTRRIASRLTGEDSTGGRSGQWEMPCQIGIELSRRF